MKIRLGDYQLSSDSHQFIVSEIKIGDGDKNKGIEYEANQTFYPTIVNAINGILKKRLLKSDATTLIQVQTEIEEHKRELKKHLTETI